MEKTINNGCILQVDDLKVRYGAIEAISGVSFGMGRETVAIIGPNGAGKSTLLKTISGILRPAFGTIRYMDKRIEQDPPEKIYRAGLVHITERGKVFSRMSVYENLLMGANGRGRNKDLASDLDRVFELFPILKSRKGQSAGTLSGGEQQMLALGRSVISRPRLLMLDEPSLGLSPLLVQHIFDYVRLLAQDGLPILLVEQNARQALRVAQRGYVINSGRLILAGTSEELMSNSGVIEAYLGHEG